MFEIFSDFRSELKRSGYINEIFTFVDAAHLIAKTRPRGWKI